MNTFWKLNLAVWIICFLTASNPLHAQPFIDNGLIFTSNIGLFEKIDGSAVQIPVGPSAALFPNLSRDGQFLTFSRPDLGMNNGIAPSADLVVINRANGQQRVIIDNDSVQLGAAVGQTSSQVSPSGQFVVFGQFIFSATGTDGSIESQLQIVDFNTGVILSSPIPSASDTLSANYRGISFLPNSDSFVTAVPVNLPVQGLPSPLPSTAIVRFDRTGGQSWSPNQVLSSPTAAQVSQTAFQVTLQTYPALSPDGTRLAYFDVVVPDVIFNFQPSVSRVIVANADGSNPVLLQTFPTGLLPTGLTWSPDNSTIVVSVAPQLPNGNAFVNVTDDSQSQVHTVSATTGQTNRITELNGAFSPTLAIAPPAQPEELTISGTQQADDIIVTQQGNQIEVNMNGVSQGVFDLASITRLEIFGFGGGDLIEVNAAVPTFISGGFGADEIFGGSLENEIQGGPGPDTIFGGPRDDVINAGRGQDTVNALGGNDTIIGGDADDTLFGGAGDDEIVGGLGGDTINGGPGNDEIFGNTGADELFGAGGNDFLSGQGGPDTIFGGPGSDDLTGGEGFDSLNGGTGTDNALDQGEIETSIEG